jgi:threonine synthase
MKALSAAGSYEISEEMKAELADFYGNYASETETAEEIAKVYGDTGYVLDTHTAVASAVYGKYVDETKDTKKAVIASTASPYKFTRSVLNAIDAEKYNEMGDFELVDELAVISGVAVPNAVEEIRNAEIRHKTVCEVNEMQSVVKKFLGI